MTQLQIKVANNLPQKLNSIKGTHGFLLGCKVSQESGIILDATLAQKLEGNNTGSVGTELDNLSTLLPFGIAPVGVWVKEGSGDQETDAFLQTAKLAVQTAAIAHAWPAHAMLASMSKDGQLSFSDLHTGNACHIAGSELLAAGQAGLPIPAGCVLMRCPILLSLDVYGNWSERSSNGGRAVREALNATTQLLGQGSVTYLLQSRDTASSSTLLSPSSQGVLADLCRDAGGGFITARPLVMTSPQTATAGEDVAPAPVFRYQPAAGGCVALTAVPVALDVLCVLPGDTPLAELAQRALLPALRAQLDAAAAILAQLAKPAQVRAHHFAPPGRNHPVTMLYVHESGDKDATDGRHLQDRLSAHRRLALPTNIPLLRTANAINFDAEPVPDGKAGTAVQRLRDVHSTLAPPGPTGHTSLLDGSYEYFHYMQDRFNDSGWGCAYRSLQTIISWFRVQNYTTKPVPSHKEIQQILVRLGDKPESFVGSSNWIGAIELSYILDDYLGVTSKIITVNRGSDIPSKARELSLHFQTQGTPIMIGGGVLAYTLLGVHFNDQTGECAFLILDPHYTGGEDLKKMTQGSWVAWKRPGDSAAAGGPLFVQDAFYNFLCPQRPSTV